MFNVQHRKQEQLRALVREENAILLADFSNWSRKRFNNVFTISRCSSPCSPIGRSPLR
jgi:hypothetical protein